MAQGADVEVVLQVGADAGQVGDDVDAEPAQLVAAADAGEHQQLRRIDRAAADDHLACRLVGRPAAHRIHHAAGAPSLRR